MARGTPRWEELKNNPRFAWKSTNDPKYIKDRDDFFAEHGNGWWWSEAVTSNRFKSQMKKQKKNSNG